MAPPADGQEGVRDPVKLKEAIDIIKRIGSNALFILRDVLDYSKMVNHKLKIQVKEFNIVDTVHFVLDIAQFTAVNKDVQFKMKVNLQPSELMVISDEQRLQQILVNLLSNAIKVAALPRKQLLSIPFTTFRFFFFWIASIAWVACGAA